MVEWSDGTSEPCLICRAIASSLSSFTKSAFQYHCMPGVNSPSNMLCNMGYGMGAKNSKAGVRNLRAGSRILFACSSVPVEHHTMPHIFLKCNASGKGGAGGTV